MPAAGAAAGRADPGLIRSLNTELATMRAAARVKDEPAFVLADRAFHDLVLGAAGNPVLASMVAGLREGITSLLPERLDRRRRAGDARAPHPPP